FFFQAEDGIRDFHVTGVQTCALPIWDLRGATLLLAEQIGVALPPGIALVSEFEVFEPTFDAAELVQVALEAHPSLNAVRAQESRSEERRVGKGRGCGWVATD